MKVTQITQCGVGMCPTVFKTDDGNLLIVGELIPDDQIPEEVREKIGTDEAVVKIPADLVKDLEL